MLNASSLTKALKAEAQQLGFAACGVTRTDGIDSGDALTAWLAAGHHATMGWMEARADERASPVALWAEAKSVIALGISYAPADDPLHLADEADVGRISVYARGSDYHDVVKRQLKALARWLVDAGGGPGVVGVKVFVDTAPVMEKPLGAAAGLGWQGKHTNLVSRAHGSWLFLGCIMTTLALDVDTPHVDRCGTCDACQRACPTDAFPEPYRLDARRCISYLTIEHRGTIATEFRRAIGNRIYGCDDCLAVCPWNRFASAAAANKAFVPRAELAAPALGDLLALDDAGFRQVFAGSPIKRIGRDRMVRNAAIAAGNSGNPQLLPVLKRLAGEPNDVVAETARWAIDEIDAGEVASVSVPRADA